MSYREQFQQIMYYGAFDRMPVLHWGGWQETVERWYTEGLPKGADQHAYFNANCQWSMIWGANTELFPLFDEEILEETAEYKIFRGRDGVVAQEWKGKSSIPHYIDFTLKKAKDWPEYKKRLQPDAARIPENLEQQIAEAEASGNPVCLWTGSLMGNIRNWMGVENMSFLMYDDRDVYADMVMTIADLACWNLDLILPRLTTKADLGFGWEDICGRSGPLVSPAIFDECVAPGYRKIRRKLEEYGIDLYGIDSDGDVSQLIGHWLEGGVNVQFPIEVGPMRQDAMTYREQYGRELRMIGNFDKMTIEEGPAAIEAEIARLMPLIKDGGFLLMPDHLITPGVSLEAYCGYLDRVREIRW